MKKNAIQIIMALVIVVLSAVVYNNTTRLNKFQKEGTEVLAAMQERNFQLQKDSIETHAKLESLEMKIEQRDFANRMK